MCACPCSGRSLPPQTKDPASCPAPGPGGGGGGRGGAAGGPAGGPPQKRQPCGPKPCGGTKCTKCGKNGKDGKGGPGGKGGPSDRGGPGGGSGGPSGLRAPPNNRGPAALGLAALLFAFGVFVTIKLGIVANEIG
ncbi:collagen alpha-1(III) chain [Drosophila subpulchrella]|uniref:collagen alpha-1(III) chain n=1 Tax=Drosophila subpulchrella TaxID=1486046 RepID=UPI0018A1682E|nr:collagen alpha-1(III) chain [Drosophila subpulchrella]